ncbi:hypothetical protein Q675_24395 [Labrenzia sp. C1B70]|nr:hypothetical protein Q675_24395 [Labrenzia sp. C1B70]
MVEKPVLTRTCIQVARQTRSVIYILAIDEILGLCRAISLTFHATFQEAEVRERNENMKDLHDSQA